MVHDTSDHVEVQDVVAIHKHDLATLAGIKLVAEPIARSLRYLAAGDDERMVDKHPLADLGVKDLMTEHHVRLVVNLGDVGVVALGHARGIMFSFLRLQAKVKNVLRWQGVLHPHILAVLQCLVLVPRGCDAGEACLPEQGQQHFLDELVL
jgi:hypothetical protein